MIFHFGEYTLDAERRELLRGSETVVLTPKVFQTLLSLVQQRDRVVTKAELCQMIWPDQFVEEANLTQNISVLRRTLDDAGSGRKHIVTFYGHGYRFIEPVTLFCTGEAAMPDSGESSAAVALPDPVQVEVPASGSRRTWFLGGLGLVLLLLAGMAVWRPSARRERDTAKVAHPPDVSPTILTRLQGAQFEPAWSPDGLTVAFIGRVGREASSTVYLQRAGEMQARALVSGNGLYNSPAWSPDGKQLALVHVQGGQQSLDVFDVQSGRFRRLTSLFPHRYGLEYRHLDWSPDGSMLVVDDKDTESNPLSLYLVHLSDGGKTRLTFQNMDIVGDVSPRFSPDGGSIAFVRIRYQGINELMRIPVSGGEAVTLLDPANLISDVDWESQDRLLVGARLGDDFRLWRLRLGPAAGRPEAVLGAGGDLPLQFRLNRSSGRLVFSAYSPDLNIWSLRLDEPGSWQPLIMSPGQDNSPIFSPDGKWLCFRSDAGGQERMWVSAPDGSHAHMVDTGTLTPAVHGWDADSRTLIFKARHERGLYAVGMEGGNAKRVWDAASSYPARYISKDSFLVRQGNFIYRVDRRTGGMTQVTSHGGAPIMQSRDGRYLYFGQGRMSMQVGRLDTQTHAQETVVHNMMAGYSESWTLADKGIYYLAEAGGRPMIVLHPNKGPDRAIAPLPGDLPPVGDSGVTVSPDGKVLLVVSADPAASNVQEEQLPPE